MAARLWGAMRWAARPPRVGLLDVVHLVCLAGSALGLLAMAIVLLPLSTLWRVVFNPSPKQFKSVLITGASVGLGAGLAAEFAGPDTTLFLTARKSTSLSSTKEACEAKGAQVICFGVDVTDQVGMQRVVDEAMALKRLDLVIANAGITGDNGLPDALSVVNTNLNGTLHTILPVIDHWQRDGGGGGGSVGIMSSLNGHVPVATTFMTAYATTKVGLRILGESLRISLARFNIHVTVLCPGMTESRMVSQQQGHGIPMITGVTPQAKGCKWMADAIRNDSPEVGFPASFFTLTRVMAAMPAWFRDLFQAFYLIGDPYVAHSVALEDEIFGIQETDHAREKYE